MQWNATAISEDYIDQVNPTVINYKTINCLEQRLEDHMGQ